MPTVGVVIVGNEILSGKFADENGPFLIRRLRALGADLKRIATIPDEIDTIASEIKRQSAAYDHVISCGGVGPTHDDVTFEGVAAAFGIPLVPRPELLTLFEKFGMTQDPATLRMAAPPEGAELVFSPLVGYPIVFVRNVAVLPGVPKLMQAKFEAVAQRYAGREMGLERIYVTQPEWMIAERLTALAAKHPGVQIGSYPRFGEGPYDVILTLESRDREALEAARAALQAEFPTITP